MIDIEQDHGHLPITYKQKIEGLLIVFSRQACRIKRAKVKHDFRL